MASAIASAGESTNAWQVQAYVQAQVRVKANFEDANAGTNKSEYASENAKKLQTILQMAHSGACVEIEHLLT
jgi:hypothetical protein